MMVESKIRKLREILRGSSAMSMILQNSTNLT